ncbi:CoA transferase [Ramlibacter sp.]|uniref:CoA transferase n=1 Tax=Ramlibacter sp. TaxID=1917967 RepID=UPI003D0E450B
MYPLLTGLRIVECASFIAAPSCSLYLQQLGAEVIRVDPIGGGADFKRWPLSKGGDSYYWEGLNKGKKSVAIDLARPEGRQLLTQLITAPGKDGGILVTNLPKEGFLSHERLSKHREDLITVRVMGWGDGDSGFDYTVNAALGVPFVTGSDANGDAPVNHVLPAWDLLSGAYAAFATLAAERNRLRTGRGGEVTVPLSDIAFSALANMGQIAEVMDTGDRPRYGNALYGAFGRDFRTSDGERVMVAAITPKQWSGLVKSLDLVPTIQQIEKDLGVSFARDEGTRFTHRDTLFPIVERAIGALTMDRVRTVFDENAVCWGPYFTLKRAIAEYPRLKPGAPLFDEIDHPSGHRYPAAGAAATFVGMDRERVQRAPHLGEHTDEVLASVLSLSSARIGELHASGLVASAPSN